MRNPPLPDLQVTLDPAAPAGDVLRPLAQLLLQVARRRLRERQQKEPASATTPTAGSGNCACGQL
jgi:hypothetical protein